VIGWLSGVVVARDPAQGVVVINVGGVGYEVRVSMQTLASVGDLDELCTLWIHTYAREDALTLFGFASPGREAPVPAAARGAQGRTQARARGPRRVPVR
jgi:Holliday junction resolvasome RuvABC DNA-binding subunit